MGWIKRNLNGIDLFQCEELNNNQVIQGVSGRSSGNMALHTGDDPRKVVENRRFFLKQLGLGLDQLVVAEQVHGTNIKKITATMNGLGAVSVGDAIPETDALITKEQGVTLSIFTADCLPIFLYDPITPAIGIVHAGWRGTIENIAVQTLAAMNTCFGTKADHCWAAVGPAICGVCFKVDPQLAARFSRLDPEAVSEGSSGFQVDLARFNRNGLHQAGIPLDRIIRADLCTSCQTDLFYSYRAEAGTIGRIMGVITLRN